MSAPLTLLGTLLAAPNAQGPVRISSGGRGDYSVPPLDSNRMTNDGVLLGMIT